LGELDFDFAGDVGRKAGVETGTMIVCHIPNLSLNVGGIGRSAALTDMLAISASIAAIFRVLRYIAVATYLWIGDPGG
jgi:hypothetical protein